MDVRQFMLAFVDEFAEMLARFAPGLRPAMISAMSDSRISSMGAASHDRFALQVKQALLGYADEFGRADAENAVEFSFRVIYATLARYLGLGSSPEAAGQGDWAALKQNLSDLCTSYLIAADIRDTTSAVAVSA